MRPFDRGFLALGVILGISIAIALYLVFDLVEFPQGALASFLAAIFGAIVGGGISIVGTSMSISHSEKLSSEDRKREEFAALRVLLSKTTKNLSLFRDLKRHLESEDRANNIFFQGLPILSKPMELGTEIEQFTTFELSLAIGLSNEQLFNLLSVSNSNGGLFNKIYEIYESKMTAFLKKLNSSNQVNFDNGVLSGEVTIDRKDHFELSDIQKNLWDSVFSELLISYAILQQIQKMLNQRHNQLIDFNSGITEAEISDLATSVELGSFEKDVLASIQS